MPTTIAENLRNIQSTKLALKASINAKNVGAINDSTPFSAYPNAIDAIQVKALDMSDSIISDSVELKDYTGASFTVKECIKEFTIPEGVTSISSLCFSGCISLQNIAIPSGVTELPNDCFYGCSSLETVSIPDSVKTIGSNCFYKCSNITGIAIPSGVTALSDYCFQYCSGLTSIVIPRGITSIGRYCFSFCSNLKTVTCNAVTPPTLASNAFAICYALTEIYVPAKSVNAYKNATNWSSYADKIQAIP